MATTLRKTSGESTGPIAPTFSYAQAAKGAAKTPTTTSSSTSKVPSGTITPSKDSESTLPNSLETPTGMDWAEETEMTASDKTVHPAPDATAAEQSSLAQKKTPQVNGTSGHTSPEFGTSSTSTLAKEDDEVSVPNLSSESTWENKSQASVGVEKASEHGDVVSEKGKHKEKSKPKAPSKPLTEAPPPPVNIWMKRAEEQKAKAAHHPTTAKPAVPKSEGAARATSTQRNDSANSDLKAKNRVAAGVSDDLEASSTVDKLRKSSSSMSPRGRNDEKPVNGRQDSRTEHGNDRSRRGPAASKVNDEVEKTSKAPPPVQDQSLWPTPDTAKDEDRKRAQEKAEKVEKTERVERDGSTDTKTKPHGKNAWVSVPYTPTVVFATPGIPAPGARRGGRGGGRGGRDAGGRGGSHAGATGDKADSTAPLPNGESGRRGRPEGNRGRSASPAKGRRAPSVDNPSWRNVKNSQNAGEALPKPSNDSEGSQRPRPAMNNDEAAHSAASGATQNMLPRNSMPPPRNKPARKGEASSMPNEKRRESEANGASKDYGSLPNGRRASVAPQDEGQGKDQRSTSEPYVSHARSGPSERRGGSYQSFSNRDRPEGRGRGGYRGGRNGSQGYQGAQHMNGMQFSNGQVPYTQGFSNPRSPTTFHGQDPQSSYFTPQQQQPQQQQQPRNYRGGSGRAQSIPVDSMYNRGPNGYGMSTMAPLQTQFSGGSFDYQQSQSASAIPFQPYFDPWSNYGIISSTLEYYFSFDNMIKDTFLRKHLDSQGFCLMSVVAGFNRMVALCSDIEMIKLACVQSKTIEYKVGPDNLDRLRSAEGWERFVLPMSERFPEAQNDGPKELYPPPMPHPRMYDSPLARQSMSAVPASPGGAQTSPFQSLNGIGPYPGPNGSFSADPASVNQFSQFVPQPAVASGAPNGSSPQPMAAFSPSPNMEDDEPDTATDEQVDALRIVVRKRDVNMPQPASPPQASRTFSNGSIDNRNIAEELHRAEGSQPKEIPTSES
ncbi:hypothetical protein K402DRAFT_240533 [Aulographum hederae CBS 113979]|uniref:HTH La-type RNA-binding domain-containing protein n=1 Tax=Aulographum hederae CBS 113979 TaxID=1176131 RepID=A0A6G1GKD0_9PEZI|nr:hypothetical protein K402DRAFT_240533 [Aulographum hederae CBS 113979]